MSLNTEQNRTRIGRWLITALLALIGGFGAIGLISVQVQVGPVTLIIGDHNKVENGGQTQSVIQPAKPQPVEAKPSQPASQPISVTPIQEEAIPITQSQPGRVRRTAPVQYEVDEDCSCPNDEPSQPQSRPAVQRFYSTTPTYVAPSRQFSPPRDSQYQTQTVSNDIYSQSQSQASSNVYVNNNGVTVNSSSRGGSTNVYVQSDGVSVRSSSTGGTSHTRVVINGKVVVDQ